MSTTLPDMQVFVAPDTMRMWSLGERSKGHRVGVVPTMGALHEGHLALVDEARRRSDRVIVTIFVNPLQFNQSADFASYPQPIDDDLVACERAGVDAVYAPTASVMYPPGFQTHVEPGDLASRLEGPKRPGHFRGVATVVTKLLGATAPDLAVFGQKDFQQLVIIRRMVADLDLGIEICGVPIVRDADGLAKSSRNVLLTPADRAAAPVLSRALAACAAACQRGERSADSINRIATSLIEAEPRATLEYVDVVDTTTLRAVDRVEPGTAVLIAAWFGGVRLIDNLVLDGD